MQNIDTEEILQIIFFLLFVWLGFLFVFALKYKVLPLISCEDVLCLQGEGYKRRAAVLQSGSGSDLRNTT